MRVSSTGQYTPWIRFFAEAVAAESTAGHARIMRLLTLREDLGARIRNDRPRGRLAVEIVDDLIAYPILSVTDAHRRYGRTDQANRNAIALLVDLGYLRPYGEAKYDRLYWNPQVFQIIDA